MEREPATGLGLLLLGAGIAASALLGPLVFGTIQFRVSASAENQLLGGDVVSLFVAAPLAVAAGVLWLRRSRLAAPLAVAPGLYAVYLYVQYVLGPEYDRYPGNNEGFFPLYLALIIVGWVTALRAWQAMGSQGLPPPSSGLRRTLAALLLLLGVLFALTWLRSIADVVAGSGGDEYQEHPTLFWLVRLMDLAFIIPAALATGAGLLRRAPWAVRTGYALAGFLTLLVAAVAGMAVTMEVRGDPAADRAFLAGTLLATAAFAAVYAALLRRAAQRAPARQAVPR
ncbi:MAG TPA: hypothetical protein VIO14_05740 [Dehalococcoidia bacterium]